METPNKRRPMRAKDLSASMLRARMTELRVQRAATPIPLRTVVPSQTLKRMQAQRALAAQRRARTRGMTPAPESCTARPKPKANVATRGRLLLNRLVARQAVRNGEHKRATVRAQARVAARSKGASRER